MKKLTKKEKIAVSLCYLRANKICVAGEEKPKHVPKCFFKTTLKPVSRAEKQKQLCSDEEHCFGHEMSKSIAYPKPTKD